MIRVEFETSVAGFSTVSHRANPVRNRLDVERVASDFYAPLYRFALALTHSETEAADLTQETFLILSKQQAQIREAEKIKSWLFSTLRREFLRGLRARALHPEVELNPEHEERLTVDSTVLRTLDANAILDALSKVDEAYRTALELFYLGDLSYKQIAAALRVPIGTVMSRLSRGKEQLRCSLAKAKAAERR
jgi:RNA polymerase sigma-70 factor, ECF subfamily